MPIVERDPWRMQYFEGVACPEEVFIPTEDPDAYLLFPRHRWVYNKMMLCETQGLEHAPHGVKPPRFPVFSKPIYNLRGMGIGGHVIESAEAYEHELLPGHMWMPLLGGDHVSSDVAVVDGEALWWRHARGLSLPGGMFDYWTILAERLPALEADLETWLRRHLGGYAGIVNFETIGGTIIECHLRFADQWPDLYGAGWLDAVVGLYAGGRWSFADGDRRTGYSVVLFGSHGPRYPRVERALLDELLADPEISSIQITFHEDRPPELHAMPPGGFRLAIVNCTALEAGVRARQRLALHFWSAQEISHEPPAAGDRR